MKTSWRIKQREKDARCIEKATARLLQKIVKAPSFKGKANLMDCAIRLHEVAYVNAENLRLDLLEE